MNIATGIVAAPRVSLGRWRKRARHRLSSEAVCDGRGLLVAPGADGGVQDAVFERMQPRRERVLRFARRDRERGARDYLPAIDLDGDAMDRRAAPCQAREEGIVDRVGATQRRDARAVG